jgi:proton-coupled amino acid transporter
LRPSYGALDNVDTATDYGSQPAEDPEIVKRHLVQPHNGGGGGDGSNTGRRSTSEESSDRNADEFSSLQLQGGDITRPIYRWTEEAEMEASASTRRRRSFTLPRPEPETETMDISAIKVPGGFRRDFIRRTGGPTTESQGLLASGNQNQPRLLTSNFLEFLTLYGHFAGEELQEDDEVLGPGEYFAPTDEEAEIGEETALLPPGTPGKHPRRHKERAVKATNSSSGAMLLLLKSFVGTGVLFLPRAFLNGGMLFSSVVLVSVSLLSYYCFILLVRTRQRMDGSFGDIGGALYGKHMRNIILASIALSQFGFVSAYLVFVSANLQAFVLAVSNCSTLLTIKFIIFIQFLIFLPLSLIRDISKLAFTALIADAFILLGLIYLYGFNIKQIAEQGGFADIKMFNANNWTLFIGTAIFTYEGVGLIIPIQESMKRPDKFPQVLGLCMVIITAIFLSMGMLGYATFGSATETVLLLNLPQDKFVLGIQLLYAIAIFLSAPLQLFPAIRILENGLFVRSGKYNPGIKWRKNVFRFFLVAFCALVAWGGARDLDKFVALVGSFACVPLVYVYPVSLIFSKPVYFALPSLSTLASIRLTMIFRSQCSTSGVSRAVNSNEPRISHSRSSAALCVSIPRP